jgi:omega-amidase
MKIAAAQIDCVVGDVNANVRKIRSFAERAKSSGTEWIVFPEMSDTGYVMSAIRQRASPWSEGAVPELRLIAQELDLGIVCGVSERAGSTIFSSQVVIDAGGDIIAKYGKTHLFAVAPIEEQKCFAAGTELATVAMGELRAGLRICYDLRFPEIYRALALDENTNIFLISSAWPLRRVEHLRTLAAARAIENQSYVVLANRVGTDDGGIFSGSSAIIDPAGALLATASTDREELLEAEVSLTAVVKVRERMPVLAHRRPEIYRSLQTPIEIAGK